MKFNIQKSLQASLVLMALLALMGCGSSKTSNDGFGSAIQASTSDSPAGSMAVCSQDMSGVSDMQVRLMQFTSLDGSTRSDYVRLQIYAAPAIWQANNLDMLVYRWTAAPDNSTSLDANPLYFQFEKKVGAGFELMDPTSYQIINFTEIQQFAQIPSATSSGITANSPQDFFSKVSMVVNLRDTSNSYQALRVVLRDNGTVVRSVDVLIPTFLADPAKYNADPRHPVTLQYLHPMKDKLGQNWSDTSFGEFARSFCF